MSILGDVSSLLAWLVVIPIVGAIAAFVFRKFAATSGLITCTANLILVTILVVLQPEVGVIHHHLGGWPPPLGIQLQLDGLSLFLLFATAIVCFASSVYATGYIEKERQHQYWPLCLFLLCALNALFLSHDIFNLYVTIELLGLTSVALVSLPKNATALRAGMRYLLAALTGSMLYLMGVAFMYHGNGTLDISLLREALQYTPSDWIGFAFMAAGLMLKTAIFPLHFWLPPAHASAPSPVSALLSALVVKATLYILIRLWLELFAGEAGASGILLSLCGGAAVIWGSALALQQSRVKTLIAYSTVAQLGYLLLAFSLVDTVAWQGVAWLALSHALAKAAMFLAAGNILSYGGHDTIAKLDNLASRMPLTISAFALGGVSLMGLPPSAGFVGKWLLLQAAFTQHQYWIVLVVIVGGLMTAAYVFKVLGRAFTPAATPTAPHKLARRRQWAALLLACIPIILGFCVEPAMNILAVGQALVVAEVKP